MTPLGQAEYWIQPNGDKENDRWDVWMRDTEGFTTVIAVRKTEKTARKIALKYNKLERANENKRQD